MFSLFIALPSLTCFKIMFKVIKTAPIRLLKIPSVTELEKREKNEMK